MPDRLLFNSRTSLQQHRDYGFSMARADYLPNGFDTARFSPDGATRAHWRNQWGVREDAVVFGNIGRYHPFKDHANFLQAAARVRRERPASRFVLAGPGVEPRNAELMGAVHAAGLAEHVDLLGERRDVAGITAALDVYVSSSATEAFSNSVGEAMCCALPCVVTDVGDSAHVVGNTGRVVPPRDPEALALAMIAMHDLGSAGRCALGAQARQRVEADFGIEAVAGRYAALYASLAEAARSPA